MSKSTNQKGFLPLLVSVLFRQRTKHSIMQTHDLLVGSQCPTTDDREAWKAYWKQQGQQWRTEPEINTERQQSLTERRDIIPNIEKGIYPFKGIEPKLTRADMEWLLTTHENGRGPVIWSDESQRDRVGLDLRGADLSKLDLRGMPLACIVGGLAGDVWKDSSPEQDRMAAVQMEGTILIQAHLEGAKLNQANLRSANLFRASFLGAELCYVDLSKGFLNEVCFEGVDFTGAHLEGAYLKGAHFEGVSMSPANLQGAFFDRATTLNDITLGNKERGFVRLADISWGDVNLSVINWSKVSMLGDEQQAQQEGERDKKIDAYQTAVRAYRQLAVVLHSQGMREDADRFAYQAQVLQELVFLQQIPSQQKRRRIFLGFAAIMGGSLLVLMMLAILFLVLTRQLHSTCLPAFDDPNCQTLQQQFSQSLVALPPILLVAILMSLGGLLLVLLPQMYLRQERQSRVSQGHKILSMLVFLLGLLLLVLPPAIILLPIFLSLPLPIALSLVISPSLLYLSWKLLKVFYREVIIEGFRWDISSIIGLIFAMGFLLMIFPFWVLILFEVISPLLETLLQSFPPPENIQLVFALLVMFLIWKRLRRIQGVQKFKQNTQDMLVIYGKYSFSLFLDVIAGYGYKPVRSLIG